MIIFLYGLLGFIFLVFFHELGHFLAAKMFGITVTEFAVGMGPSIVKKEFKGTMYKLCIIPLGGYCAIKGQEDFGSIDRNTDKDSFFGQSAWKRFTVVFAGPLFSFILGYFLISLAISINGETRLKYTTIDPPKDSKNFLVGDKVLSINGEPVQYWDEIQLGLLKNIGSPNTITIQRNNKEITIKDYIFNPSEKNLPDGDFFSYYKEGPTIIVSTAENSPASKLGLTFGDVIETANGTPIRSERDLSYIMRQLKPNQSINLVIKRYDNIQELFQKDSDFFKNKIYPYKTIKLNVLPIEKNEKPILGVGLFVVEGKQISDLWEHKTTSFPQALITGWDKSWNMLVINAKAISQLVQGNKEIRDSLSGPIKIFYEVGKVSQAHGFVTFLSFIGGISLALAFFNFLPLPALDGGHMLIAVIEGIVRRPIHPKALNIIQMTGVVLLLSIFVLVTIKDISELIS